MAARLVRIDPRQPGGGVVDAAAAVLRRGGIVALPTETFYGLAVDPENPDAVSALFRLKRRDRGRAVPILIGRREQLIELVRPPVPAVLDRVAGAFWPGPLNILLPVRPGYAPQAVGGGDRIALRLTSHAVARAVIERFGGPVTGTSANRSGQPPCRTAAQLQRQLGSEPDLILDGGRCPGGLPSTLIDLSRRPYRILRPGAVPDVELRAVLGPDLA